MARFADLLIDTSTPLEELARQLATAADGDVSQTSDPRAWRLRFGDGCIARLAARHTGDQPTQPFARYPYAVSAQLAADSTPAASSEVRALRRLAQTLAPAESLRTLLVIDAQNRPASRSGADGTEPAPTAGDATTAGEAPEAGGDAPEAGGPPAGGEGHRPATGDEDDARRTAGRIG